MYWIVFTCILTSCGLFENHENAGQLPKLKASDAFLRDGANGKYLLGEIESNEKPNPDDSLVEWVFDVELKTTKQNVMCRITSKLNVNCIQNDNGWVSERQSRFVSKQTKDSLFIINPIDWDTAYAIKISGVVPTSWAIQSTNKDAYIYFSSEEIYRIDSSGMNLVRRKSQSYPNYYQMFGFWKGRNGNTCFLQTEYIIENQVGLDNESRVQSTICVASNENQLDSVEFPFGAIPKGIEMNGILRKGVGANVTEWNDRIWFSYCTGLNVQGVQVGPSDSAKVALASIDPKGNDLVVGVPYVSDSTYHWGISGTFFLPRNKASGLFFVVEEQSSEYLTKSILVLFEVNAQGALIELSRYEIDYTNRTIDRAWVVDTNRFAIVLGGNLYLFRMDGKVIK